MTLLEYIKSMDTTGEAIYSDEWTKETGIYVNINAMWRLGRLNVILDDFFYDCLGYDLASAGNSENIQYITGADFEYLNKTELVIDEEVSNYKAWVKYPYYQLRGKRVTEEQALDIIRRTDGIFQSYRIETADAIDLTHFYNDWFDSEWCHGWCHPSGIIGLNANTSRWPELDELIGTMIKLKYAFPYLDFAAGITGDASYPWCIYDRRDQIIRTIHDHEKRIMELYRLDCEEYPDFADNIKIGIWLHDEAIEFMGPQRAGEVYMEYEEKYSEENRNIYARDYYRCNQIVPAGIEYLMRCVEANGLFSDPIFREYISIEVCQRLIEKFGQKVEKVLITNLKAVARIKRTGRRRQHGSTDTETASGSGKRHPAGDV